MGFRSTVLVFVAVLLVLSGCGEPRRPAGDGKRPSPDPSASPTATPEAPPPPLQCEEPPVDPSLPPDCTRMGSVASVRQMSHPAGAIEVDLRLEDGCGRTLPRSYAVCLDAPGSVLSPREYESASTLLLVAPPSSTEEASVMPAAIDAFVAARPDGERIAVHRLEDGLVQVADFTRDHARLSSQLAAGLGEPGSAEPAADAATALQDARAIVSQVDGVSTLERRAVVVLAPGRVAPPLLTLASSVVWVDAPVPALMEAVLEAAAALDVIDAAGVVGLGTCAFGEALLSAPEGPLEPTSVPLIAPLPEAMAGTCAAAAAAAGVRAPLRRVAFSFSGAERATYRSRDSSGSAEDFPLSVQLGGDVGPVPAKAHFRGKSSFDCSRRNYNVDLDGTRPHQVIPGLATDEFLLIAMCYDTAYSDQVTGNQLAAKLGFMPYRSQVVELVLDGESRGVYLLMGKPKEQLRVQHARPQALLRRSSSGSSAEVKYAAPNVDAIALYEALLDEAMTRSGADLLNTLEREMDVDQLLRWVALNSLLSNGDSVDEVFFLATEAQSPPSGAFFIISAWDLDDLYASCHSSGSDVLADTRGLSYCVEGRIERRILMDRAGYPRYVEVLSQVLAEITPEVFRAALDHTAAELLPFLADPAVRAASREIGTPATQAEAEELVRAELKRLEVNFAARRQALLHGVATYDGGYASPPPPAAP